MKFFLKIVPVLALVILAFAVTSAPAQDDKDRIERELEKTMSLQSPLVEDDVKLYLANVEPIFRLRFEPEKLIDTIKAIGAWPEDRFAYVTTKMAVGMSLIMRPDDARNQVVPDFARPTPVELALIKRYQDELTRAMSMIEARYATASGS